MLLLFGPSVRAESIPDLPDPVGFGGPFVGVDRGALIVAGGANFPDKPPWEGGTKVYYDSAFVLPSPDAEWVTGLKLPKQIAYGAAVPTDNGLILIGGMDADTVFADVTRVRWNPDTKKLTFEKLPPLPEPSAYLAAGRIEDTLYVAAGQSDVAGSDLPHKFWSLKIGDDAWQERKPWPGKSRNKSAGVVHDGAFYLLGGTHGKEYLTDGYRYRPDTGWRRIADLPRPAAAAPVIASDGKILVYSGDTGEHVGTPPGEHPGFPKSILAYDVAEDRWTTARRELTQGVVTTGAALWRGRLVIASGEIRPGVRTPRVWAE